MRGVSSDKRIVQLRTSTRHLFVLYSSNKIMVSQLRNHEKVWDNRHVIQSHYGDVSYERGQHSRKRHDVVWIGQRHRCDRPHCLETHASTNPQTFHLVCATNVLAYSQYKSSNVSLRSDDLSTYSQSRRKDVVQCVVLLRRSRVQLHGTISIFTVRQIY